MRVLNSSTRGSTGSPGGAHLHFTLFKNVPDNENVFSGTDPKLLKYAADVVFDATYNPNKGGDDHTSVPSIYSDLISLYPNPSSNSFRLNISATGHKVQSIVIINSVGAELWGIQNTIDSNEEMYTHNLPNGAYLVLIRTNKGFAHKKLIVLN